MSDITITANLDMKDVVDDFKRQEERILNGVIKADLPRILREAQAKGFPDEYTLLVRSKGREYRRQLKTLNPKFFRVGTKRSPLEFTFIAGETNVKDIKDAAIYALNEAIKRAPSRSGNYRERLGEYIGTLGNITKFKLSLIESVYRTGDSIFITSPTAYSSVIEHGFYKKYYETQSLPGGILLNIARKVRRRYGSKVAVRFVYISHKLRGAKTASGTIPVIQIGPKGQFAAVDTLPGAKRRRRRG